MTHPATIAVLVTGPVYGSQDALSAFHYTKTAIELGHKIQRVFFYNEGVHNASALSSPASDEFDLHRAWIELANAHGLTLDVCVAAALRRGVIDQTEADNMDSANFNLVPPFQLSGLGQLAESLITADRVIQF